MLVPRVLLTNKFPGPKVGRSDKLSFMSSRQHILKSLSDGAFHSGTELGHELGISRAAVNKAVQGLVERGVDIHSVPGKGYRWPYATPLLEAGLLARRLDSLLNRYGIQLEVCDEVESTSAHLLDQLSTDPFVPRVCLAEIQTGGRGRRGRAWQATPYQNITCSISWRYEVGPARLSGLSIAAGVVIVRALHGLGVEGVQLKWPNDLLFGHRKLAGILVDMKGEADGPTELVLGFGLNMKLGAEAAGNVDQPWIDLAGITSQELDRNEAAAAIASGLIDMLADFSDAGLEKYAEDWQRWHAYQDKPVRLYQGKKEILGIARGIDISGALKLDAGDGIQLVHSGEVSLRAG